MALISRLKAFPYRAISFEVSITLCGFMVSLDFVPFKFAKPGYRNAAREGYTHQPFAHHIFFGPFHLWTMADLSGTVGFQITIDRNVFHGTPLFPKKN